MGPEGRIAEINQDERNREMKAAEEKNFDHVIAVKVNLRINPWQSRTFIELRSNFLL